MTEPSFKGWAELAQGRHVHGDIQVPVSSVVAGMLVSVDDQGLAFALGHRNSYDLVLETTLIYGGYARAWLSRQKRLALLS